MQKGFYLFIYSTSLADKSEDLNHQVRGHVGYILYHNQQASTYLLSDFIKQCNKTFSGCQEWITGCQTSHVEIYCI